MKFFVILAISAMSGFAGASSDFEGRWHAQGSNNCFHKAWEAAQPTDVQKKEAHQIMLKVHNVHQRHEKQIKHAAHQFHQVMSQHPISHRAAFKAGRNLQMAVAPVQRAMFGGGIQIINLLDLSQRVQFNSALHDCMKAEELALE